MSTYIIQGGKVTKKHNKVIIDISKVNKYEIKEELMRQMRSSVIFAGSLLEKHHRCTFCYPGGRDIWWIHWTSLR